MSEFVTPEQVNQAAELAELRLEKWQNEAVRAHPEAALFRDLLVGSDRQQIMDLAADLANRRRQQREEQEVSDERGDAPRTPPTYVTAGAPEVLSTEAETDEQDQ